MRLLWRNQRPRLNVEGVALGSSLRLIKEG
jgi:hypothetical protein